MRWGYNSPTNDESRLLDELKSSFKATQLSKVISGCPASLSNYDRRTEYSASRERPVQTDQTLMSHRGPKLRTTSIEKYNSPEKNGGQLTERQSSVKKGLETIQHNLSKRKTTVAVTDLFSEATNRNNFNETASDRY